MRHVYLLVLSATLIFATGCTEDNPEGTWDVGEDGGGNDAAADVSDDTSDPDTTDSTDPDTTDATDPDTSGDTSTCGAEDQMCDWNCPDRDPDCANCPDKSEFTAGPWDTESCMLIDYGCEDGDEIYSDEVCGCGCVEGSTDPCAPQDARGEGACAAVVGVIWNGESCVSISGCSCVGSDCDKTYDSVEACENDRSACLEPDCAAQDARGVGPCDAVLGWAWTGSESGCQAISGCECRGADCDALYESQRSCQEDNVKCGSDARCGGFGGIECPDDMYCDFPDDGCGFDDGAGVCRDRPEACPEYIDEVCACDGQIYTNECFANASGTDVYSGLDHCEQ
ncbi:MAG: hypothetical protein ACQEVA_00710 [Myxococcota bacterium]